MVCNRNTADHDETDSLLDERAQDRRDVRRGGQEIVEPDIRAGKARKFETQDQTPTAVLPAKLAYGLRQHTT